MLRYRLKSWIIFSLCRLKFGLVMIKLFVRMTMHLVSEHRFSSEKAYINMSSKQSRSKFIWILMVESSIINKKAPSTKKDQWTAFHGSWHNFDKDYCLEIVNSMFKRIRAVVKAWEGTTKYCIVFFNEFYFFHNIFTPAWLKKRKA